MAIVRKQSGQNAVSTLKLTQLMKKHAGILTREKAQEYVSSVEYNITELPQINDPSDILKAKFQYLFESLRKDDSQLYLYANHEKILLQQIDSLIDLPLDGGFEYLPFPSSNEEKNGGELDQKRTSLLQGMYRAIQCPRVYLNGFQEAVKPLKQKDHQDQVAFIVCIIVEVLASAVALAAILVLPGGVSLLALAFYGAAMGVAVFGIFKAADVNRMLNITEPVRTIEETLQKVGAPKSEKPANFNKPPEVELTDLRVHEVRRPSNG